MLLNFDALADQFDSQRGLPRPALQAWMERIDRLANKKHLDIIEPGIGTGRIALPLAVMGHTVTGTDISRPMLVTCAETAERLGVGERLTLLDADATDVPLGDAAFDLGIIAQLLYLVADWPAVLDELARLVKPGGHVIHLTEPTTEGDNMRLWSTTWRGMIEATGYRHIAAGPADDEVQAEFLRRWPDLQVQQLASWDFGQSVAEAMENYGERLRPLYQSVPEGDWLTTTDRFLAWAGDAFPHRDERLQGTVTLTAMIAAV